MIHTSYLAYLIIGIVLGGFYYHHVWLEASSLGKNNPFFLLRFWVRFSGLTACLTLLFYYLPESVLWIALGISLSKPVYLYTRKKTIFGVSGGK